MEVNFALAWLETEVSGVEDTLPDREEGRSEAPEEEPVLEEAPEPEEELLLKKPLEPLPVSRDSGSPLKS